MDYKEQIEQLRKQIDQLEQQINKPKIEVGKVYKATCNKNMIGVVTEILRDCGNFKVVSIYGFDDDGEWTTTHEPTTDNLTLATPEEWTTALTKYCDELYKDCDRVDRSGLDLDRGYPVITELMDDSSIGLEGSIFMYKGVYVMDKHGRFAKGLKKELDYDVSFKSGVVELNLDCKGFQDGKYKLVRVD